VAWDLRRGANLSNLVAEIREALGDHARTPLFIRTVHGFGYAFCGDATTLTSAIATPCSRAYSCGIDLLSTPDLKVGPTF
jgi:DNA-binding winged helix-turn-helix (wHTH) protein